MKEFEKAGCRQNRVVAAFLLAAFVVLLPSGGRAEILCHILDPQDPTLNVRDSPGGSVVNRLQNERVVRVGETKIDTKGRAWVSVSGIYQGEWRNWGWVFRNHLQCVDTKQFPRERLSVSDLKAVGIVPQTVFKTKTMPVSCNEVPNGWGVTISNELYEAYRRRGFSRTALCLALGGDGVHFDPATGQRLKLYEIGRDIFDSPRPLWLPDCYRQVQIIGKGGYLVGWRPTGCTLRYHPSTGLPINNPELVELSAGGEAGGAVDEDNRSSTVSEDRLRSLVNGR